MSPENGPFLVRTATRSDEALIAPAWERAYGPLARFKYPGRWSWNVLGNPYVEEHRRPLVWIATDGGRVAAWTTAFVVPLEAAGRSVLAAHSCDTFTLPEFRRHGFGQQLQAENQAAHSVFIAVDPSPANRRNKYRVGGWPGRPLATYLKLTRSLDASLLYGSLVEAVSIRAGRGAAAICRALGKCGGQAVLGAVFSAALGARPRTERAMLEPRTLEFRAVDAFDSRSDDLWKRVSGQYSFAVRRDAKYLNWKYVDQPNLSYRKLLAYEGASLVGTLIYRTPVSPPEQSAGLVSECFCIGDEAATYAAMFARAQADLAASGVSMVRCGASTPGQERALDALGYRKVDIDVPVVHVASTSGDVTRSDLLAGRWLLSLGDSDLDQIREMHQPSFVEIVRVLRGRIPGSENLPRGP